MTFQDNRDRNLERAPLVRSSDNRMAWVLGAIALLVIGGFIFYMSNDKNMTASNDTRPAATSTAKTTFSGNSPATTTGSGSSAVRPVQPVQPTNPAGNVPTTTPSGSPAR